MSIPMQVTPGALGRGFCPTSEQARLNAYAAALAVTFPLGLGNFSLGNATPEPDMNSFPWYRYNSDGSPDKWYSYFNGSWVAPHPISANDQAAIRFYTGSYASIATYDGGDTNTPGAAAGPMWAVLGQTTGGPTDFGTLGGKVPLGASASIAANSTGGNASGQVTLDLTNVPAHKHGGESYVLDQAGIGVYAGGGSGTNSSFTGSAGGNPDGSTAPINILPPYLAGYWIARSSRIFYLASEAP